MDIKLKARLAAYAKVETFQPSTSAPGDSDDLCDLVTAGPVREERIDTLFHSKTTDETVSKAVGASIIDSLFNKE